MIKHTDQNDKRFFTGKECFWQTIRHSEKVITLQ